MRNSTWYQSKGDQRREQSTKKEEVRSLKFLIAGTKLISYHISMFTNGIQWLQTRVCLGWSLELHSMEAVLEDNGLKDFVNQEVPKTAIANAQELVEWKKCVVRARRILLEGV